MGGIPGARGAPEYLFERVPQPLKWPLVLHDAPVHRIFQQGVEEGFNDDDFSQWCRIADQDEIMAALTALAGVGLVPVFDTRQMVRQGLEVSADSGWFDFDAEAIMFWRSFWTWVTIAGLSMTPNLVLGPSVAVGVGIKAQFSPWVLLPVVTVAGYCEGLFLAWIAGQSLRIAIIDRWVTRLRTPRSMELAQRWGVWGGLTVGCAVVGQEPILVALRWLGVEMKRIWLPLAVSNAGFAVIYYQLAKISLDQLAKF